MRLFLSFCAVATSLTLGACATTSATNSQASETRVRMATPTRGDAMDVDLHTRDDRSVRNVPMPAVQAFDALPAAYAKLGIPTVAVLDTSGGVYTVGVRNLRVHGSLAGVRLSRYLDCGNNGMRVPADSYDVSLSVTTYVTPASSGSELHTLVTGDARDPAANAPPVRCTSVGALEGKLGDLVAAK